MCLPLAAQAGERFRFAFFHTELSRDGPGILLRDILSAKDAQVGAVVRVVRSVQPDVLVLAGVDWDLQGHALRALADAIGGYPHRFAARPNRGVDSGHDLDGDGRLSEREDAVGFADFAGQEGLAVLSALPLGEERDFSGFRWTDLPGNIAPEAEPVDLPLSTTAHWDVPVILPDGSQISLLIWHATPPVFDGPKDRNGRRNHDEAAFWSAYLDGAFGHAPQAFVLMGAANMDIADSEGRPDAMRALMARSNVTDPRPASEGGRMAANAGQSGDAALDTADWPDEAGRPGNLRVDYVLPSTAVRVLDAGVVWPAPETSLRGDVEAASRHRLVWVDIDLPERGGDGGERLGRAELGQ